MTELSLLAGQIGVSDRTLRRAINQGTLHAQRPTPRKLRLSFAEKAYARRSWQLLATLRTALRTESNVRFALLFGSAARGDDTPSSDVDLLVQMRDPSLERVVDLSAKLEGILGRRVDILHFEDAGDFPGLIAAAVSEGRVLVDRENSWSKLSRRRGRLEATERAKTRRRARSALAGIDRMLSANGD
jgi:predicted nucleotidyltransferase